MEILDDHVNHCVAGAIASGDGDAATEKSRELLAAVHRFARVRDCPARAAAPTRARSARPAYRPRRARGSSVAAARGPAGAAARSSPDGCRTAFQSSIVTRERQHGPTPALATAGAATSGSAASKAAVTGSASATKFVPQRGEKRERSRRAGHVRPSARAPAAAIARCSAPCRRSVRPRMSHATTGDGERETDDPARPARAVRGGTNGSTSAARRSSRSRVRATPRPRTSGVTDAASWSRPPQQRRPRREAAAVRHRSFVQLPRRPTRTPSSARSRSRRRSGRAMPPSRGSAVAASARASTC